jgi:hypothetical protein
MNGILLLQSVTELPAGAEVRTAFGFRDVLPAGSVAKSGPLVAVGELGSQFVCVS